MDEPDRPILQPMMVERRPGIPLATVLLAVGACAVLAVLAKPVEQYVPEGIGFRIPPEAEVGAGVWGGFLGVIVGLYCAASWRTLVCAYFAAGFATAVAVRLLVEPHDMRVALAGSALLIAYALIVRLADRKSVAK